MYLDRSADVVLEEVCWMHSYIVLQPGEGAQPRLNQQRWVGSIQL